MTNKNSTQRCTDKCIHVHGAKTMEEPTKEEMFKKFISCLESSRKLERIKHQLGDNHYVEILASALLYSRWRKQYGDEQTLSDVRRYIDRKDSTFKIAFELYSLTLNRYIRSKNNDRLALGGHISK